MLRGDVVAAEDLKLAVAHAVLHDRNDMDQLGWVGGRREVAVIWASCRGQGGGRRGGLKNNVRGCTSFGARQEMGRREARKRVL